MRKEQFTPNPKSMDLLQEIAEASKNPIMLPLDSLFVDDEIYHKHINYSKVLRMAKNFRPEKFKPILVGKRNGAYYIIDGQHRHLMAGYLKHTEICCYIVDTKCAAHEMYLYLAANQ